MFKNIIRLLISTILIMVAFGLTIMQQSIIDTINNDWIYMNSSYVVMAIQVVLILIAVINIVSMLKHIKAPKTEAKFSRSNKILNSMNLLTSVKQNFNQKQKRILDKLNTSRHLR